MLSLASKLMALLIAFVFLGATAQCAAVCVKPESPPCHHHQQPCAKPLMIAEHVSVAQFAAPAVTITFFEVKRPSTRLELTANLKRVPPPSTALLKSTILLI
jgi:hypothetical protein